MSLQFFSFRFAIYCLTHFQTGSLLPLLFILRVFFPLFLDLLSPPLTFPTTPSFLFQSTPHLLHLSFFQAFCFSLFHLSFFQAFSFPCFLFYIYHLAILSSPLFSFISLLFYLCSLRSSTLLCSQTSLFSHVSSLLCFFYILSRSFCPPPHPRSSSLSYVISFFLSSMSIFSSLSLPFYLSFLSLSLLVSALCSPFSFLFPSLLSPFLISSFPPFSPHPFLLALILTFPTFLKERTNSVIRLWAEQTNNDHKPFHA